VPVYHVESSHLRTACGLTIDVDAPFSRAKLMGWASRSEADELAVACRRCFR